jgi:hypothetical protein
MLRHNRCVFVEVGASLVSTLKFGGGEGKV